MGRANRKTGNQKYHEWKRIQLDRLAGMGLDRYNDYLKTDHWRAFKRRYYETHARKCHACGHAGEKIVLHHKTYERLGQEREDDVVPLCDPCHSKVHLLANQGKAFLDVAHTLIRAGGGRKGEQKRGPAKSGAKAKRKRDNARLAAQRQAERERVAKAWDRARHVDRKIREAEEARRKRCGVLWTAAS